MSDIKTKLYQRFEDMPSRKGRGGTYQYIKWQDVADRMNEVFGSRWSSEVVFQDIIGKNIIVRVSVCIKDPDTGERFCQEGFGGAVNDDSQEAGNPFKAAYSKALKDACKKWGVGLYLDEEDGSEIPVGYTGKEFGVPPVEKTSIQAPPFPTIKDVSTPPPAFVPEFTPPTDVATTSIEVEEPEEDVPTPPVEVSVKKEASGPSFPPIPPFPSGEKIAVPSKYSTIKSDDISDVQKVALQSILKRLNIKYEALVEEAFKANGLEAEEIPQPDNLTYQQAVHVVKYGNDKFRNQ